MTISERVQIYAERYGFAVFPLYTIQDGCSCGKRGCTSPGKHPIGGLAPQGVNNASTDLQTIREWWSLYPDANVGIATGDASGVVVLDLDDRHGGIATVEHLEARNEELPRTWVVETGGGGLHVYFRMPAADVRNSAGAIGPGVDVRGSGGYVVAPPSTHASGTPYRWSTRPDKMQLADVPDWLLERMAPGGSRTASAPALPHRIKEGERNVVLASAAGTMRRRGFCEAAILAALLIENTRRCAPPLSSGEIERIAKSIERYPPPPVMRAGESRSA